MTYFRICSTCQSRSQAYAIALALMERFPTVRGLRAPPLLFGEETAPVKLPTTQCPCDPDKGTELEPQINQAGISRMAPL